jgi:hypothetical protein
MEENRGLPRKRVLKTGSISFGGGVIDCVIRNFSPKGAALEVATPIGIPDEFDLVIAIETARRRCAVIWRKEKLIGVAFY